VRIFAFFRFVEAIKLSPAVPATITLERNRHRLSPSFLPFCKRKNRANFLIEIRPVIVIHNVIGLSDCRALSPKVSHVSLTLHTSGRGGFSR
jgi:hypothetical protein